MPNTSKKQPAGSRSKSPVPVSTTSARPRKPLPEAEKAPASRSSARTLEEKAARFQALRAEALKRWRARED